MIALLNKYFVPIHLTNEDYVASGSATQAEKDERARIMSEVFMKGENNPIRASDAAIYILDTNGHLIKLGQTGESVKWSALKLPECLVPDKVVQLLEEARTTQKVVAGQPIAPPRPQSRPPNAKPDELVLHLTARYAPSNGTWKLLPSEDWLILEKTKWTKLLPAKDAKMGDSWDIDKQMIVGLLLNFYPPTSNRDPATNKIYDPKMKATVVSIADGLARVRLDSTLKMKHRFFPLKDDDHLVEAKVVGYVDADVAGGTIKDIRLVTETGTYANDNFGISVRLHPSTEATASPRDATGSALPVAPMVIGLAGLLAVVGMWVVTRRKTTI